MGSPFFRQMAEGKIPYIRYGEVGNDDPANSARGRIAFPVAAMDDVLAEAIGAETRTILFSVADATKQLSKDGELRSSFRAEHYALAQAVIDAGEVFLATELALNIQAKIDGVWWFAVLRRATINPAAVYLKSFRQTNEARAAKLRARPTSFKYQDRRRLR